MLTFSLQSKLLAMCLLLVFLTTVGISTTFYILTEQDKHRESRERIQIALDLIFDDLRNQKDLHQRYLDQFLLNDASFGGLAFLYRQDPQQVGSMSFLAGLMGATESMKKFGQTVLINRLRIFAADARLLAVYRRTEEQEIVGGYVTTASGMPTYLALDDPTRQANILFGETPVPDAPLPDGVTAVYDGEVPQDMQGELFREDARLGLRITAPLRYLGQDVGFVVSEVFYTQDTIERYAALSKAEVNFFAGNQLSIGTLPAQASFGSDTVDGIATCENFQMPLQPMPMTSVVFDQQEYYQGACVFNNSQTSLGALTISFSKAIEQQAVSKILTAILTIAGIVLVFVLIVGAMLSERLSRPIRFLSDAAKQVSQGHFDIHIPYAPRDEIGVLCATFGQMSQRLKTSFEEIATLNRELERRVQKRTAEVTRQKYILDTFMANVPDSIYFKDCEGRITQANQAFAARFGRGNPSEFIGKADSDFFSEEQARLKYAQEREIIRSGQPITGLEEPDAQERWALTTKMPLRNEHGEIIGTFGISRDITDLKHTEQELLRHQTQLEELVAVRTAEITRINECLRGEIDERQRIEQVLRASEQQYRSLAENVKDGVVIVQAKHIVFVNEAFAGMLGYTVDSLFNSDPSTLFPEHIGKTNAALPLSASSGLLETGSPWQVELNTSDARTIWTEIEESSIVWQEELALLLTIRNINQSKLREFRLEEERSRLRQENLMFKSTISDRYRFGKLIGKSAAMQGVYDLIISAAASEANVVISGESGTGKELIARTIHQAGMHKDQAFVPVNCASIPETLFEREFFGHRKGAFTGADRDHPGLFDRAHQGILFLDEVTELSPGMQAKLLRVLQDGEYTPLGSNTHKQADVMIIAATNKNYQEEIKCGRLRQDFFYRIGVIEITVSPLRKRKEDLPLLIEHILDQYRQKHPVTLNTAAAELPGGQISLPGELVQALYRYDWPGNVRELQNLIHRYLATSNLNAILNLIATPENKSSSSIQESSSKVALSEMLQSFEKQLINDTLARTDYNTQKTADELLIPLHTLYRRMKRYDLIKKNAS